LGGSGSVSGRRLECRSNKDFLIYARQDTATCTIPFPLNNTTSHAFLSFSACPTGQADEIAQQRSPSTSTAPKPMAME